MPKRKFLPDTRIELFEELDAWAERRPDLSSKSICILTGGVGTGKSTIASEFSRCLTDRGSYGASFFFDCGVEDVSTPQLFFSTLAYQLAQAQKSLRIPIINAAREYLKVDKHEGMEWQGENLFRRPISQVDSRHTTVVLVVDAVDVCKELAPPLLDILTTCVRQAPFPLCVFITSLPDANGENTILEDADDVHKISLDNLPLKSVTDDIALFLHNRLSWVAQGKAVIKKQPDIAARLAQRMGRSFLGASLTVNSLLKSGEPEHFEEHLKKLLDDNPSIPEKSLGHLDRCQDMLESIGRLDVAQTVQASACQWEESERRSRKWGRLENVPQPLVGCDETGGTCASGIDKGALRIASGSACEGKDHIYWCPPLPNSERQW